MTEHATHYDVLILGAGGAGMMCALKAAARGRRVAILDHSKKPGGKIIISGGGRCNFTNLHVTDKNYVSQNPHFAKSALSRFGAEDIIAMVRAHGIAFHERKHGQLFCDDSAQQLIDMFVQECKQAGVEFLLETQIQRVQKQGEEFWVDTSRGRFTSNALVVATGGLSIPKMGATAFGYELAKQFGLQITALAPALDGFVFGKKNEAFLGGLSGIAIEAEMSCNGITFRENLLFTHVGLSGPVSLQASLHWGKFGTANDPVYINFVPQKSKDELLQWFQSRKNNKGELKNMMVDLLPKRIAERFCERYLPANIDLANLSKKDLEAFCEQLQNWEFVPESTVGYGKAEVTRGGVNTNELSSKTMESKKVPGLYFIGEVVDVTGWLGGFNYQWAWASGSAAGEVV